MEVIEAPLPMRLANANASADTIVPILNLVKHFDMVYGDLNPCCFCLFSFDFKPNYSRQTGDVFKFIGVGVADFACGNGRNHCTIDKIQTTGD